MCRVYPIDDQTIQEMVAVIVNEVNPVRVILFGSRAKQNYRPDSDIDLLVIERYPFVEGRSRRKEAARLWRALARYRIPKDILVYTQEEIEAWSHSVNHVLAQAMREGIVLYENL